MDRSKHIDDLAKDGSSSVAAPNRSLFGSSSNTAGTDGVESYVNEYAEASQAREIGRTPRPIDGPHLSRPNPTVTTSKEEIARTGILAVSKKPSRQTKIEAKKIRKAAGASDDHQASATSGDLPRLMRVEEVAAYLSVSKTWIWRLLKKATDFPPPIRMGGTTRWDRQDVDRYIEASKSRGLHGL